MPFYRCPKCSILYQDAEIEHGVSPCCNAPLGPSPGPLPRDVPAPAQTAAPIPRRAAPFLLGLFIGCLIGLAGLWAALWLGAPPPGGADQTAELQSLREQNAEADNQARQAEAARQAAASGRAEAEKALKAANRRAAAVLKQKEDAALQLRDAGARLDQERRQRASLEKVLAEQRKPRAAPALSFVRDWQLLGPFASTGEQGHDTVYPPEREPVQLKKAHGGFGNPVKWRPYHSAEDKIDLAAFFKYHQAGVAFAVTWVHSDGDQDVTLGVGSDDGIRLWVNGKKVHDVKGGRQARPGQDAVKAHLKKGWNEVLAKVDNILGTWEFYLEFRSADGRQPLKVFSTSSPR
jgi:type II secretory pathway component PulM